MNQPGWLQRLYWTRWAQPKQDRILYRYLLDRPYRSVLELGIGDGRRLQRIAHLIQIPPDIDRIRYIGVDEFESATDGSPHLTLKEAHRMTGQLGFRSILIPGTIETALMRVAHKHGPSDLVVINGHLNPHQPDASPVCSWLDRIAHPGSVILASGLPGGQLQPVALTGSATSVQRAA